MRKVTSGMALLGYLLLVVLIAGCGEGALPADQNVADEGPARPSGQEASGPARTASSSAGATGEPALPARVEREQGAAGEPEKRTAIYGDQLQAGWSDWSWEVTVAFSDTTEVRSGSESIALAFDGAWSGLYLHVEPPLAGADYDTLSFWIHGGAEGERALRVLLAEGGNTIREEAVAVTAPAGQWTLTEIPLEQLGGPQAISGIVWQETTGEAQPTLYLDDVQLLRKGPPPPTPAPIPGPALLVEGDERRHTIPDEIYGVNFADEEMAQALNIPVNRWGGNATTRYNWQLDVSNRAGDWFFENIPDDNPNPALLPDGSQADQFVAQNQATGAETVLTIPMIGWSAKSREVACGFSIEKYGPQQGSDPQRPDCGDGVRPDGSMIRDNDPADTSVRIDPAFVQAWLRHLTGKYGTAAEGGVGYYALDNEPMLWHKTHRDVHPEPVSYDEIRDLSFEYGAAIKEIDPSAQTLGPTVWGWSAYFYSAVDGESGNWDNPPDRGAHEGTAFIPWYLQQMRQYEAQHGTRILDYLDLHYYPQGANVALSPAGSEKTEALRLRSTRALWDPAYVDESWIDEPVQLIPRMRQWVAENYPGTRLALTEYNWGGLEQMNGALAQAEILGIFGREGLDLATLWSPPALTEPGAFAFRLYRNYDGEKGTFGEISVAATSEGPETLSIFAARRSSDDALTVMIVNKESVPLISELALAGVAEGSNVERYQYSEGNLNAIERLEDQVVRDGGLTLTYPANGVTLLVIQEKE